MKSWLLVILLVIPCVAAAQVNPYARLSDPLSVARLDDSLHEPIEAITSNKIPPQTDPDEYNILASVSGKGILTHLWFVYDVPDTAAHLKIWVDDKLIASCTINELVTSEHGPIRPPLARYSSGCWVSDVQVPFEHSLKITYHQTVQNLFWYAVHWRPVLPMVQLPAVGSAMLSQWQREAEQAYTTNNLWVGAAHDSIGFSTLLKAQDTIEIAALDGPGYIQTLCFEPTSVDRPTLDSLIVEISWDDCSIPSVSVSLGKLFGALVWPRVMDYWYLKCDGTSKMTCLFPMPFEQRANIKLINIRTQEYYLPVSGYILYSRKKIDRRTSGYFYTSVQSTPETRYHVWHPMQHTLGRGQYVGTLLQLPTIKSPDVLEGDPMFTIDSNPKTSYRLTGTEDYFDGGNYFTGQRNPSPFGGCFNWATGMCRFHCLDAITFSSSFDFDFQHGYNTDVHEEYQTVTFYYKQWVPFWIDRDTIKAEEQWGISGSGYTPLEQVSIVVGDYPLTSLQADEQGKFKWIGIVPNRIPEGKYIVSVNTIENPNPIYVIKRPAIRPLVDTLPIVLEIRDTLSFSVSGFLPGERLSIYLDSELIQPLSPFIVRPNYRANSRIVIPSVDSGDHQLSVIGEYRDTARCSIPILVTSRRDYEFERLSLSDTTVSKNIEVRVASWAWWTSFGEQSFVQFRPDATNREVSFDFWVPKSGKYSINGFTSAGFEFGRYDCLVDGIGFCSIDGYDPASNGIVHSFGPWNISLLALDSGLHRFSFIYKGHDPKATDSLLWADRFFLTPYAVDSTNTGSKIDPSGSVAVELFPNPVSTGMLFIRSRENREHSDVTFRIVDRLGHLVAEQPHRAWDGEIITLEVRRLCSGEYDLEVLGDKGVCFRGAFIVVK